MSGLCGAFPLSTDYRPFLDVFECIWEILRLYSNGGEDLALISPILLACAIAEAFSAAGEAGDASVFDVAAAWRTFVEDRSGPGKPDRFYLSEEMLGADRLPQVPADTKRFLRLQGLNGARDLKFIPNPHRQSNDVARTRASRQYPPAVNYSDKFSESLLESVRLAREVPFGPGSWEELKFLEACPYSVAAKKLPDRTIPLDSTGRFAKPRFVHDVRNPNIYRISSRPQAQQEVSTMTSLATRARALRALYPGIPRSMSKEDCEGFFRRVANTQESIDSTEWNLSQGTWPASTNSRKTGS